MPVDTYLHYFRYQFFFIRKISRQLSNCTEISLLVVLRPQLKPSRRWPPPVIIDCTNDIVFVDTDRANVRWTREKYRNRMIRWPTASVCKTRAPVRCRKTERKHNVGDKRKRKRFIIVNKTTVVKTRQGIRTCLHFSVRFVAVSYPCTFRLPAHGDYFR